MAKRHKQTKQNLGRTSSSSTQAGFCLRLNSVQLPTACWCKKASSSHFFVNAAIHVCALAAKQNAQISSHIKFCLPRTFTLRNPVMFRVTVSSTSSSVTLLKASFSGSQQYLEGASLFQDHQHKPGRRVVAFSEMQLLISLFPSFADYEKTANSKRLFTLQWFVSQFSRSRLKKIE